MVIFLSSSVNYLIIYLIYCTNPPYFPLNFIAKTSNNLLDKKGSSPYYFIPLVYQCLSISLPMFG